jgi:hypothetical protein
MFVRHAWNCLIYAREKQTAILLQSVYHDLKQFEKDDRNFKDRLTDESFDEKGSLLVIDEQ